ncbi:MAG TPA: hypothetical protein VGJ81_18145 [Thermoanaerobaculia bacterium]|jgi:hypothetical protein
MTRKEAASIGEMKGREDLSDTHDAAKEIEPPKWKKNLLRSSLPLEHDAARILSRRGFSLASQPYSRVENGIEKEFSIDLRGVKTHGPSAVVHPPAALDVLVECKYRHRGMNWLFLQEPAARRDSIQNAVQGVDLFSPRFATASWFDDATQVPECYSYAEIGEAVTGDDSSGKTGGRESQIKRGVRQLQYAMPSLITLRARWSIVRALEENYPFFFVLILLTNAKLLVGSSDFGVKSVEDADGVVNLGQEVPFLLLSANLGPDFYAHARRQLPSLAAIAGTKNMKLVEESRAKHAMPNWLQPSGVISRIAADGADYEEIADCMRILVVNIDAFDNVLAAIDQAFKRKVGSVKDEPLRTW